MPAMFQSAPGFLAGRNESTAEGQDGYFYVSIRSRLFGREKR